LVFEEIKDVKEFVRKKKEAEASLDV